MKKFCSSSKTILFLSALMLLLIVLFCGYYGLTGRRNAAGSVNAQVSDNRAVADIPVLKNASPFETAKAFWNLSRKGDLGAIDALITKIPASYWVTCEETSSSLAFKRRVAKRNERIPTIGLAPGEKDYNFREDLESKSIGLLKSRAEDLKTSQFQDLELVDQKIYSDEALVIAKFKIADNYYGKPVYYMTRIDGVWKIFFENNRDYGFVDTHAYYATPRRRCRDN